MLPEFNPEKVKKILIRGTNWIGDAVLTIPAISEIGKHFPNAQITLLAKFHVCELLSMHPHIQQLMVLDDKGEHGGFSGRRRLIHKIKSHEFDLLILLQNAFEGALIGYLSKIPIRYGYQTQRRGFLLTHPVPVPNGLLERHHVHYYTELLKPMGIDPETPSLDLGISKEEEGWARERLRFYDVDKENILIGLNPGAAYGSAKRWPDERFAELGQRLVQNTRVKILIFGNKDEYPLASRIAKDIGDQAILLAGQTRLRELIALMKMCDLLVTNDSGPMHIASALGVPVLAIFGSTDPRTTGPLGDNARVIRRKVGCSPCQLRVCPIDHRCMEWITAGEVFNEICHYMEPKVDPSIRMDFSRNRNFETRRDERKTVTVFLDRDGTLNKDVGYVNSWERMAFYPGSVAAIKALNQYGIKVVLVTNQSGIARGMMTEAEVQNIHWNLEKSLDRRGVHVDGIYYCPHHPEAGNSVYTRRCHCRKPEPGLIEKASQEHGIDPRRSYVVGDKCIDMMLARRVGAKGVLVLTGYGNKEVKRCIERGETPEIIVPDILSGVEWIIQDLSESKDTPQERIYAEH